MKNQKREFKWFTITQYEEEQEYLRTQHRRGWKFVGVTFPGIYRFVACEPEDVIYQLDYNQDREKNMGEYIQMFGDCGWEYLCDFVGYSYFRKPVSSMTGGEEEIFNDDASKLDMIKRVYRTRLLPLGILFGGCICPQLVMSVMKSGVYADVFAVVWSLIFILYVSIFASSVRMYWRFKKKAEGR